MRSKIPMGRLGDVEESAAMVCFMASEECSFTTASTFDTSGGRTTFLARRSAENLYAARPAQERTPGDEALAC
jgi:hypothetical protein